MPKNTKPIFYIFYITSRSCPLIARRQFPKWSTNFKVCEKGLIFFLNLVSMLATMLTYKSATSAIYLNLTLRVILIGKSDTLLANSTWLYMNSHDLTKSKLCLYERKGVCEYDVYFYWYMIQKYLTLLLFTAFRSLTHLEKYYCSTL